MEAHSGVVKSVISVIIPFLIFVILPSSVNGSIPFLFSKAFFIIQVALLYNLNWSYRDLPLGLTSLWYGILTKRPAYLGLYWNLFWLIWFMVLLPDKSVLLEQWHAVLWILMLDTIFIGAGKVLIGTICIILARLCHFVIKGAFSININWSFHQSILP